MANKDILGRFSKVFGGKPPGTDAVRAPDVAAVAQSIDKMDAEIHRLRRAVEELSMLNDLALAIGASVDPEEIVRKLVDRSLRAVKGEQAVVTLADRQAADTARTNVRVVATSAEFKKFHLNESLLGWMYLHKKPLLINDPGRDERFRGIEWDGSVRSVLSVPLLHKGELIGVLTIYNKKDAGGFTEADQQLAAIIGAQSAQIIENARQSSVIAGMREQMRLAFEIQRNLLPQSPPVIDGYDVAGTSIPAQTVGGDYYDFIPAGAGRWAVCLGDVSGKGLPASLLMANLQAILRGQTVAEVPVVERLRRANGLMCQNTDVEKFATLFYGELDLAEHQITLGNAGHERPLLLTTGAEPAAVGPTGLALGILEDYDYRVEKVPLRPGDLMVVYSDGVTDATNRSDEMFGAERLRSVIARHRDASAAELVQTITAAVRLHAGGAEQIDDVTLVVVRRAR